MSECDFKVESACGVRELDGGIPDYYCSLEIHGICTAQELDLVEVCEDCELDPKDCKCGIFVCMENKDNG